FVDRLPENISMSQIKDIDDVVASGLFKANYWQWLEQIADYYHTSLIQVIKVALPPGLLTRSHRRIRAIGTDANLDVFLSDIAKQILRLLNSQPAKNYSWQHIQKQIPSAKRGLRELLDKNLVVSYLESGKTQQPKLQKAVVLTSELLGDDLNDRQRSIVEILKQHQGELWQSDLLKLIESKSSAILKGIADKGYIAIVNQEKLRSDREVGIFQQEPAKLLTTDQTAALAVINELSGFAQVLLHGVTGSGKTEVYLQAIAKIIAQHKSVLVLVPEIGLTPQLTDRFRSRFGDKVGVYHSALSDGERYDTWRQMLNQTNPIIIGTRSAIFAPLPNLGLIILDEEHDSSFKQDQPAPTYQTRDIANWRAQLESCPLILGSATPSLETWVNAMETGEQKEYLSTPPRWLSGAETTPPSSYYLPLPTRVQARPLPPVEIVDMRQELQQGNRSIFSRSLQQALRQMQSQNQQGILFIHRRGHSTFVSCRSCGYVCECPNCDVSLAYHQPGTVENAHLRCHYCNHYQPQHRQCPECSSPYFKFFGSGTQRVVEELARDFPQLRCLRFDSDTTRTKGAHRQILTAFARGEADLLVGTQMLVKGLDLPQVTLVGVVAADGLLHMSDYRAAERTFQTLAQVAGRCGRGDEPGKAIIQTYNPEHPVLIAVTKHDYAAFIAAELPERRMLDYPPYGALILLRFSSLDEHAVEKTVTEIGLALNEAAIAGRYEVLGPAPATVMRANNRYRWQIMIKYLPNGTATLPNWDVLRASCSNLVRMTIDVDPQNFF
ncbi:primosomal protein N', partial [Chamaesiphon sp. GL140_3_metabinner_50]|uniref:primosomal protein N' n=1 Tax=Chamaesiphon sp. GL140_3_metabinner_50 TaxID=2970812 RepID=UPI0025D0C0EA